MKKATGKTLAIAATSIVLVVGVGAQPAVAFKLGTHRLSLAENIQVY